MLWRRRSRSSSSSAPSQHNGVLQMHFADVSLNLNVRQARSALQRARASSRPETQCAEGLRAAGLPPCERPRKAIQPCLRCVTQSPRPRGPPWAAAAPLGRLFLCRGPQGHVCAPVLHGLISQSPIHFSNECVFNWRGSAEQGTKYKKRPYST
ncbi:unnamed protein product [Nyctereutes procyonoides]|uniref:(raccoon dog) hypothetical protein n=1 Tax=Nyctereutes procyonoides TaxID=34880 RepID=A0A811Y5H0_NYCPR|nr:unnamed protein product [Nyctereutes procyonoides]